MKPRLGTLVAIGFSLAALVSAQDDDPGATIAPRFSVASVKRGQASQQQVSPMSLGGGSFEMVNLPLRNLINYAYQRKPNEVLELPKWATTDVYTIRAKADGNPTSDQMRAMVRTLLADRFQFLAHQETRPIQVWVMTVVRKDGKPGPSLVRRPQACAAGATVTVRNSTIPCPGFINWPGGVAIVGRPMAIVADLIGGLFLDLKVVDRTGLEGLYDATLDFIGPSENAPANDVRLPALFTALEEQLGLRLVLQREPTPVTVIDRLEPPIEN